ncbi:ArsR family transcriptional regulator [Thermotoga maritima MSB8]|uniref:Transcriptional regulator, IclR family n=2 Tax=Thermotoga TaxID=2335 RepID=Q9WXS0_THEMA|nr:MULTISPECIES: IclR family transcriptional regulator [Thermotoga]AAD35159.1 transcriptional regulator, IclR family [Thermotoga maritima MSB8]ADA66790.1 transcriptional regulator, IclR family [Thermotoga petrophila RKU-10]AGL48988.1 Transcriptional regulator, IclR family [Thermotoga maritima MSB8]AHD18165.1 ArsR family transcriptional regulator [Thermotoga maritima MSB8]AIY86438.1 IclR family transcriptional regulator [Thermotoga sp. 2812B]
MNTLKKAFEILDFIVKNPGDVSVSEIAEKFNMSVSNAYKYMVVLEEKGFVLRKKDKRYVPGYKLIEYGSFVLRRFNIRDIAHDHLVDIMKRTGETVHLILKDGFEGVYIDKVEGEQSIPMVSRLGMKVDLYSTASGKSILAFVPEKELKEYLKIVELKPKTPNTITNPRVLKRELEKIRKRGYAVDNEENEIGIMCVGVPIFDHNGYPVAGVSISGVARKFTEEKIEEYSDVLKEKAEEISRKLGY